MLHITNGDSVASQLHIHDPSSKVLAWRDVLHEGPTPEGLSFPEMNRARAQFLSGQAWGTYETILGQMEERETLLAGDDNFTLWFEEDLYDQLQLLQILDWFNAWKPAEIALVWIPQGVRAVDLKEFYMARNTVREKLRHAGSAGWNAFCATTPKPLLRFLKNGAATIPHLRNALMRHLQEYPSTRNGLSRTERQILESLAPGPATPLQVFAASQGKEESVYMGDSTFWSYIQRLSGLLEGFSLEQLDRKISITPLGRDVLAGRQDWIQLSGIARWLGGVHLEGPTAAWRWDGDSKSLTGSTI